VKKSFFGSDVCYWFDAKSNQGLAYFIDCPEEADFEFEMR